MKIDIIQIIFQIINFSILLYLLRKYLYSPILKILEQRAKKIHEGLEAAEKSIDERENIDKLKKKAIVDAEKNATQILEGARLRAKKLEKELQEKVEKEMEKRMQKTENLASSRLKQLEQELQQRFSETVINTAETLLKNTLDQKSQREIIKNQIQMLKKVKLFSEEQ